MLFKKSCAFSVQYINGWIIPTRVTSSKTHPATKAATHIPSRHRVPVLHLLSLNPSRLGGRSASATADGGAEPRRQTPRNPRNAERRHGLFGVVRCLCVCVSVWCVGSGDVSALPPPSPPSLSQSHLNLEGKKEPLNNARYASSK